MDVDLILNEEHPELIDEWQEVPAIWDAVRYKCDEDKEKGKYILTGSAIPVTKDIHHSGAGRICKMKMYTMSLYESGDSSGDVSLYGLFQGKVKNKLLKKIELKHLADLIVRGGWPETVDIGLDGAIRITKSYIKAVLDKDISEIDGVKRDKNKMEMLLRSLARNESTISSNSMLIKDIADNVTEEELTVSRNTVTDYLDVLNKLHLLENQNSFMYKIRSRANVGSNQIEEAATNLKKFYEIAEVKPKFMCIICGLYSAIVKRPDEIHVIPITALKD